MDGEAFGAKMVEIVRGHVAGAVEPLIERIKQLEQLELPPFVTMDHILPAIDAKIAAIPPVEPGKDADPEQVAALVAEAVECAVGALPAPQDGKSVTLEDVQPLIDEAVAKTVAQIPPARDGAGVVDAIVRRDGSLALVLSDGQVKQLAEPLPPAPEFSEYCPDDTAELVALAIKTMAEIPDIPAAPEPLPPMPQPAKQLPITLNITPAGATPQPTQTRKTVTTRKDAAGNLVADIVETTE